MNELILIKGNNYGLTVQLDSEVPIDDVIDALKHKCRSGRQFFGSSSIVLNFTGRELSDEQLDIFTDIFREDTDLDIICSVQETQDYSKTMTKLREDITQSVSQEYKHQIEVLQEALNAKERHPLSSEFGQGTEPVQFHYSTVRSGQQILSHSHVVIIGDVNNGARIEAHGHVIVIGKLKGVVHAGIDLGKKAYVIAMDMQPIQIRIGDIIGRASDDGLQETKFLNPQVAYVEDDRIVMEPIHNRLYKDLKSIRQ